MPLMRDPDGRLRFPGRASTIYKSDYAIAQLAPWESAGAGHAIATQPTLVSGTALQDATGFSSTWHIPITGASSGTYTVAIGSTASVTTTIVTTAPIPAGTEIIVPVRLPANWFIKVTVVNATIGTPTVITDGNSGDLLTGTLGFESFASGSLGRAQLQTGASVGATATWRASGIKQLSTAPKVLCPNNFRAMILRVKGLRFDLYTGWTFNFGFAPVSANHGGVQLFQVSLDPSASLLTYDSSGNPSKTPTTTFSMQYGVAPYFNLGLALLPNGMEGVGDNHAWALVLKDDAVYSAIDLTATLGASLDLADNVYAQFFITSVDGGSHKFWWREASLELRSS